jgi:hypothetical protein
MPAAAQSKITRPQRENSFACFFIFVILVAGVG